MTGLVPIVYDATNLDGSAVTRCLKDGSFCSYLPTVLDSRRLEFTLSQLFGTLTAVGVVPLTEHALTSCIPTPDFYGNGSFGV